jgi:prephenate dehydratase
MFWGAGSAGPGWLVRCLAEFAERDVNLTRIESRPRRQRLGEYMFFVDLDGHAAEPAVAAAVDGLRGHADVVRVLGSFPAA